MTCSKACCLALAVTLMSLPAWAVKPGDTLYIRSKDTKVLKAAKANAPPVVTLQPGAEVVWNGADKTDKAFHAVKSGAKTGFVLMVNLTPIKPSEEKGGDGNTITGHAVASSGAATRALSGSAQAMVVKKPELDKAAKQVVALELINAEVNKDPKGICELAVKQGLTKEVCK